MAGFDPADPPWGGGDDDHYYTGLGHDEGFSPNLVDGLPSGDGDGESAGADTTSQQPASTASLLQPPPTEEAGAAEAAEPTVVATRKPVTPAKKDSSKSKAPRPTTKTTAAPKTPEKREAKRARKTTTTGAEGFVRRRRKDGNTTDDDAAVDSEHLPAAPATPSTQAAAAPPPPAGAATPPTQPQHHKRRRPPRPVRRTAPKEEAEAEGETQGAADGGSKSGGRGSAPPPAKRARKAKLALTGEQLTDWKLVAGRCSVRAKHRDEGRGKRAELSEIERGNYDAQALECYVQHTRRRDHRKEQVAAIPVPPLDVGWGVACPHVTLTFLFPLKDGLKTMSLATGINRVGRHGVKNGIDVPLRCPSVSKFHASLTVTGSGVTVCDKGSKNGTFLNLGRDGSSRLDEFSACEVRDGDCLNFGCVAVKVSVS
eukprot:Rhum_TRINITY_DN7258_c0_g1::Rhum_TRINITY_DN7258_c0_g1_i1::g.22336::m.22336